MEIRVPHISDFAVSCSCNSSGSTRRGGSMLSIPVHCTAKNNKEFTVSACCYWKTYKTPVRGGGEVVSTSQ